MAQARAEARSLFDYVAAAAAPAHLFARAASVRYTDLINGTSLGGRLPALAGRSVLLATADQLTAALALIELDGRARRITILPPDVQPDHLAAIAATAEADAAVLDADTPPHAALDLPVRAICEPAVSSTADALPAGLRSEWVMLTSGTTGVPKLVRHSLGGLIAPAAAKSVADGAAVWGTFYDIRRYGGLQIFLRAVAGGASLVLSDAGEAVGDHLARLKQHGVTHLSGTPSHWRRALINPAIGEIAPRYLRLSGEIADQAILDSLRAAFPHAAVGHAYASTEAGVAFDVNDGFTGFPAAYVGLERNGVEMKIVDGSLHIRSSRAASGYVGTDAPPLHDAEGFVDTGDIVEQRGDRYYFVGRKGGIINVGGLKVHPEEVEAVINRHPCVRMSLVRSRSNPITGAIVVAEVVLKSGRESPAREAELREAIIDHCSAALPRHKVPAAISFVPALPVAETGKLARRTDRQS